MMFVSLGIGGAIALVLIVVVSVLTGGSSSSTSTTLLPPSALVGHKLSAKTLPALNGGEVSFPWTTTHKASVLFFFASWCPPCQGEIPRVARYVATHPSSTTDFIGVDSNDVTSSAKTFVAKKGVHFPVAVDAAGSWTSGTFDFVTLPETVFVSSKGVVKNVIFGAVTNKELAAGVKSLS